MVHARPHELGLGVTASRRAVVRTAAWSVPAVSLAMAAPAFAESGGPLMVVTGMAYQTPTAWERIVWPDALDDSETTRIEVFFVQLLEEEGAPTDAVPFEVRIDLPAAWPSGATVSIEHAEMNDGPALSFAHVAPGSDSGPLPGRRIVVTGALRPGETSEVVHLVIGAQGPVGDLEAVVLWSGRTETYPLPMQTFAQIEHGQDAPPLLLVDPEPRSFFIKPTAAEHTAAGGDPAQYPPFAAEAQLRLPAVTFPPEAPNPSSPRDVSVELGFEYLAPFGAPLAGTLVVEGSGAAGVTGVALTDPTSAGGGLTFSTTGTSVAWEGLAPLGVGDSIGAVVIGFLGALDEQGDPVDIFEANGIRVTARYLSDGAEFARFQLVLAGWTA